MKARVLRLDVESGARPTLLLIYHKMLCREEPGSRWPSLCLADDGDGHLVVTAPDEHHHSIRTKVIIGQS